MIRVSMTVNGKSVSDHSAHVFHVRDGKTVEFWETSENQYEIDEAYG